MKHLFSLPLSFLNPYLKFKAVLLAAILLELGVDLVDEDVLLQGHVRQGGRGVDPDDRVLDPRQGREVAGENPVDRRVLHSGEL